MLAHIPATDDKLAKILKCQQEDEVIIKLKSYCEHGWPSIQKLDSDLKKYWKIREDLSVQEGLLLRGVRLVIPKKLRDEILGTIHSGHKGESKCHARARESVWWPGITEEIKEMLQRCPVCIQDRTERYEPLIPSEFPERPWQKVGMDLFKLNGKWFVVMEDYYSRYPEVVELRGLSSQEVIDRC